MAGTQAFCAPPRTCWFCPGPRCDCGGVSLPCGSTRQAPLSLVTGVGMASSCHPRVGSGPQSAPLLRLSQSLSPTVAALWAPVLQGPMFLGRVQWCLFVRCLPLAWRVSRVAGTWEKVDKECVGGMGRAWKSQLSSVLRKVVKMSPAVWGCVVSLQVGGLRLGASDEDPIKVASVAGHSADGCSEAQSLFFE